jgi:hypothetical protein
VRPLKATIPACTSNGRWVGEEDPGEEVAVADQRRPAKLDADRVLVEISRDRGQTGNPFVFRTPRQASSNLIQLTRGSGARSAVITRLARWTPTGVGLPRGRLLGVMPPSSEMMRFPS